MRCLAAAALLLVCTAPVQAGIVGKPPAAPSSPRDPFIGDSRLPAPPLGRDLPKINQSVERGREVGRLSRDEARQLRREARHIRRLARRYGRDGLSASEKSELETRALYLRGAANGVSGSAKRNGRR